MKQYTSHEKIQQAKMFIVQHLHFYGSIYWRMSVIEDDTCNTAWTDGTSLGYNVAWLGKWNIMQIVGVFVHEILHVILKHHLREQLNPVFKDQHLRFNMAADYALNPSVIAQPNLELPDGCLIDMDRFPDHLTEQIFHELTDDEVNDMSDKQAAGGSGGMPGEVRPFQGGKATAAAKDREAQKIDQWVHTAGMKAKNAGSMTGALAQKIRDLTTPTVNWEDELQVICEDICKNNYTWKRPNPRYISTGCYLPTMDGYRSPDMLFFVDTSGSLCDSQITQIKAEIRLILESFHISVLVVYWDTDYEGHEFFDADDIFDPDWSLNITGRGGTDFTGILDWMEDAEALEDFDPKAVVFFTDLECSGYPDTEPDLPWLWVQLPSSTGQFDHSYIQYMPDWGSHVRCHVYKS